MRQVTQKGLDLIKAFEGFSPGPYICHAGYPSIGYGHLLVKKDEDFTADINEAQAEDLLRQDAAPPNAPSCA